MDRPGRLMVSVLYLVKKWRIGEVLGWHRSVEGLTYVGRTFTWSYESQGKWAQPESLCWRANQSSPPSSELTQNSLIRNVRSHVTWSLLTVLSAPVVLTCFLTYRLLLNCSVCLEHFVPIQFFTELIPTHLFLVSAQVLLPFWKAGSPQAGLGVLSLWSSSTLFLPLW